MIFLRLQCHPGPHNGVGGNLLTFLRRTKSPIASTYAQKYYLFMFPVIYRYWMSSGINRLLPLQLPYLSYSIQLLVSIQVELLKDTVADHPPSDFLLAVDTVTPSSCLLVRA